MISGPDKLSELPHRQTNRPITNFPPMIYRHRDFHGMNMIQRLMVERAEQLGGDFSIRQHYDDFMNGGIIPIALSRWELTGCYDQMAQLLD